MNNIYAYSFYEKEIYNILNKQIITLFPNEDKPLKKKMEAYVKPEFAKAPQSISVTVLDNSTCFRFIHPPNNPYLIFEANF